MKSRFRAFNFFLFAALVLVTSCSTSEERQRKKEYSNLRIHVEVEGGDRSSGVSIHRTAPIVVNVEREPILDENNVVAALVVEQPGGFAVQIQFDRQGSWILERTTVTHRGRHLAIFSFFGEARWLAAPVITGKNSTGRLTFTPDATREEAERLVRGLNNVVRKLERKENWPFRESIDR